MMVNDMEMNKVNGNVRKIIRKESRIILQRNNGWRELAIVRARMSGLVMLMLVLFFMSSAFASAQSTSALFSSPAKYYGSGYYTGGFNKVQDYQPAFDTLYSASERQQYWPILGKTDTCEARQDFILNIPPGGCMPGVVRSDLLEEQNVPVFCQVDALKLNPLIDVAAIKSVSFASGNRSRFPKDVVDVGFHPSRKALRLYNKLLSSPLINNIGYVVVLLKRNPNEKSMPEEIKLNLAARLQYDAQNAFGAGRYQYFLPVLTEAEWRDRYKEFGIMQGKAYLRANYVEPDKASISLYRDADEKVNSVVLQKKQLSNLIYLPGFYCGVGVRLALDNIELPTDRVKLQVDDDVLWVSEGEKFLDDKCVVDKIESVGVGEATIRCPRETIKLKLGVSRKVNLEKDEKEVQSLVGERISGYDAVGGMAKGDNKNLNLERTIQDFVKEKDLIKGDIIVKTSSGGEFVYDRWDIATKSDGTYYQLLDKNNEVIIEDLDTSKNTVSGKITAVYSPAGASTTGTASPDDVFLLYSGVMPEKYMPGATRNERTFVLLGKGVQQAYVLTEGNERRIKSAIIDELGKMSGDELGSLYRNLVKDGEGKLTGIKDGEIKRRIKADTIYFLFSGANKDAPKEAFGFKLKSVGGVVDKELELKQTSGNKEVVKKNLNLLMGEAERVAKDVADGFREEANQAGEYYGEQILYQAAGLAGELGMKAKQIELLEKLIAQYPSSKLGTTAVVEIQKLKDYDYTNAEADVGLRDEVETHHIIMLDVREPSFEDASARFVVAGLEELNIESAKIGEYIDVALNNYIVDGEYKKTDSPVASEKTTNLAGRVSIKLIEMDERSAKLQFHYPITQGAPVEGTKVVRLGDTTEIAGLRIRLQDIKLKREAIVKVFPEIPNSVTETNFSVTIGIEKRGIKLSDEKTKEMIENVNESIVKFEKIVTKLGEVVKGMKAACFATSAGLIVKGLFTNMGGKSLARQQVMRSAGGWNEECAKLVRENPSEYPTINECFRKNSGEINKDVDTLGDSFKKTNDKIKSLKDLPEVKKNADELGKKYMESEFLKWYSDNKGKKLIKPDGSEDVKTIEQVFGDEKAIRQAYEDGVLGLEEMKDIVTYGSLTAGVGKDIANKRIKSIAEDVERNSYYSKQRAEFSGVKVDGTEISNYVNGLEYKDKKVVYVKAIDVKSPITGVDSGMEAGRKYAIVEVPSTAKALAGATLLLPIASDGSWKPAKEFGGYAVTRSGDSLAKDVDTKYSSGDGKVSAKEIREVLSEAGVSDFKVIDAKACEHAYADAEVRFYETSPFKGLPAVVPVDIQRGWYAATKQTLGVFGGIKPYQESGKVSSFWLCNVGENGREEWERSVGDDQPCIQINVDTGQPFDQLPCLEREQAQALVRKASRLIQEAASQYGNLRGGGKINIDGRSYKVGAPVGAASGTQCTDFMSPNDCYLLFNVCDPVVCPESRCNLGGAYNVDNVIQSGIIGSLVLCLPNIREKIFVPVCLTGVHAGLDNYVSILKAHRDCLQESLNTGSTTGICDEVRSLYMCELFWRNIGPLTRVGLPKLIEFATGQGQRGGGEYASVSGAFDNAAASIDYMKQVYGPNAYNAFKLRSSDEVGTMICKGFVGQRYPGGKGFFDALTEPDSPAQFTAWFDEIPYSDATVPATAQYKVFYHIFAGRDVGTYYSVYLKNPPESGFYANQPTIVVDTGFIGKGSFKSETKDFTAPAGYKELCVRVNNKDECGFKKVSTGFSLNYLADEYAKQQASSEVKSEKECVSGGNIVDNGAVPIGAGGLQGTLEEAAMPQIYKRGIIRVCSSANPGEQTAPGRWKQVGVCSDNKEIKCWLDTESVKDNIKNRNLENEALSEAGKIAASLGEGKVLTEEQIISEMEGIKATIERIDEEIANVRDEAGMKKIIEDQKEKGIVSKIKEVRDGVILNNYHARMLELEFRVWEKLIEKYGVSVLVQPEAKLVKVKDVGPESGEQEEKPASEDNGEKVAPESGKPDVSAVQYTYESAVKKSEELLKVKGNVKYSSDTEVKEFIDRIHEINLITLAQYKNIIGRGVLNFEKKLSVVKTTLEANKNKAIETKVAPETDIPESDESAGLSETEGIDKGRDVIGTISQAEKLDLVKSYYIDILSKIAFDESKYVDVDEDLMPMVQQKIKNGNVRIGINGDIVVETDNNVQLYFYIFDKKGVLLRRITSRGGTIVSIYDYVDYKYISQSMSESYLVAKEIKYDMFSKDSKKSKLELFNKLDNPTNIAIVNSIYDILKIS